MATGYYLGAKAGRQRYDQINRTVAKLKRSDAIQTVVEEAAEKARAVVEEGVEKARSVIDHRGSNGLSEMAPRASGIVLPGAPG